MERDRVDVGGTEQRRAPGWWRWAWIGGGFAVVALFVVLFIGMLSARRMLSWGMHRICNGVIAALPPKLPAEQRERIRSELDCVARAAEEGRADEKRLGEFARACTSALEDRRLTSLELVRIETLAVAVCLEAGGAGPR